ncbi:MAG: hypothetical protein GF307_05715, partial [candidate division Zixibacteria bacterium]|nr:hypothetical protein [candidate division Zixibacteria bacterium]
MKAFSKILIAFMLVFAAFSLANADDNDVVINEIMFDPSYDSLGSDTYFEWVELYNMGGTTVDLSDWYFREGMTFTFP